jgi:Cdc6-like AAA superfamily ATPase
VASIPPDDETAKFVRFAAVSHAFTPAAPVDDTSLFADRPRQVMRCLDALYQRGLHIALYGERGVGKTSLANVLPKLIRGGQLPTLDALRVDCNTNDDYRSIWRKVLRELGQPLQADEMATSLDPEDVRYHLQRLDRQTLVVLDELDRVEDDEALSLLADTIKTLSDHSVSVTLMLVGVATSVDHLIGEHESIIRSLAQVHMPRMSNEELGAILNKGFSMIGLEIDLAARTRIIREAEGLPHFVHLLGLHAGQHAVVDDRSVVTPSDVQRAIEQAVDSHSMLSEYQRATQSPQPGHLFEEVLLACAFAARNELGYFRAGDVREPLSAIVGREMGIPSFQRHLNELSGINRGGVLEKAGPPRHYVYRFRNPLLQPFVKMRGTAKGLLTEELKERLQTRQEAQDAPNLYDRPDSQ